MKKTDELIKHFYWFFVFHFSSFFREENFVTGYSDAKCLWFIFSAPIIIYSWRKNNDWISIQSTRRNYLTYWSQFPFLSISFPFSTSFERFNSDSGCVFSSKSSLLLWILLLRCVFMAQRHMRQFVLFIDESEGRRLWWTMREKSERFLGCKLELFHWLQSEDSKCETQPPKVILRNNEPKLHFWWSLSKIDQPGFNFWSVRSLRQKASRNTIKLFSGFYDKFDALFRYFNTKAASLSRRHYNKDKIQFCTKKQTRKNI